MCWSVSRPVMCDSVISWTVACQTPQSTSIFEARILEWVAICYSKGSSWPRDQIWISHIAGRSFAIWATREALDGVKHYLLHRFRPQWFSSQSLKITVYMHFVLQRKSSKQYDFYSFVGRLFFNQASLVAQLIKNLRAMQKTQLWFLDWEDPLEKG